jgi:hypothetical protein
MSLCTNNQGPQHVPDNAENEIRKALVSVIEAEITHTWNQKPITGVQWGEPALLYKYSFHACKTGRRLAAERWARTAKHLARALKLETKLAFLELHLLEFPSLKGPPPEENALIDRKEMTIDLVNCVMGVVQTKFKPIPENIQRYRDRAELHIAALTENTELHELLMTERINAGYEYGRVLECIILAYEAEPNIKIAA